MACNCIETTEKRVLEHIKTQNPDWNITESGYKNLVLAFDEEPSATYIMMPFEFTFTFSKVNGTQSKPRTKQISMKGEYCTFCGKKFKEL
jgi:hypothetical protein